MVMRAAAAWWLLLTMLTSHGGGGAAATPVRTGTWLSEAPATMQAQGAYNQRAFWIVAKRSAGAVYGGGTDVTPYAARSNLAAAVVHSGVLEHGQVGLVLVHSRPNMTNYVASTRFGVSSQALASDTSSFVVALLEPIRTVQDCSMSYAALGQVGAGWSGSLLLHVNLTNVATVLPACAPLPSPSACSAIGGDRYCFSPSGTSLFALGKYAIDSNMYPYVVNQSSVVRLERQTGGNIAPLGIRIPEGCYTDAVGDAVMNVTTNLTFALSVRTMCTLATGHRFDVGDGYFRFSTRVSCTAVDDASFDMITNAIVVKTTTGTTTVLNWVSPISGSSGVELLTLLKLRAQQPLVIPLEVGVVVNTSCSAYVTIPQAPMGVVIEFSSVAAYPCSGSVWGVNPYTDDSNRGRAAQHSRVIGAGGGGLARFLRLPGLPRYYSSLSNGITTSSYLAWGGSFQVGRVMMPRGTYQTADRFVPSTTATMTVAANLSFALLVTVRMNATASQCFASRGTFTSLALSSFAFYCGSPTNAGILAANYNMTSDVVTLETTSGNVDLYTGIPSSGGGGTSACAVMVAEDAHCVNAGAQTSTGSLSVDATGASTLSSSATNAGSTALPSSSCSASSSADHRASSTASLSSTSTDLPTDSYSPSNSLDTTGTAASSTFTDTSPTRSMRATGTVRSRSSTASSVSFGSASRSSTASSVSFGSASRSPSKGEWMCATTAVGGSSNIEAIALGAAQSHDLPSALKKELDTTGVLLIGPPELSAAALSLSLPGAPINVPSLVFAALPLPRAAAAVGRPAIATRFVVNASHRSLKPWAIVPMAAAEAGSARHLLRYDDGYRTVPLHGDVSVSLVGDGSSWVYTLVARPPGNASWAPQGIGIYQPAVFWLSASFACSGSNNTVVQTLVLEVPLLPAPYTLATEVARGAASSVDWASAVSGPGSGVSVGRVTAVRSVMLCSSDPSADGGGILGISLRSACDDERSNAGGRIGRDDDRDGARIRANARGAIGGNGIVLLVFAGALGLVGCLYGAVAGSVASGIRRVALPSSLFPVYLVTLPSTAGAVTTLMAQHAASPCGAGDVFAILAGWVMCVGPLVLLALLPHILRRWAGLSLKKRVKPHAPHVGGCRRVMKRLRFRSVSWEQQQETHPSTQRRLVDNAASVNAACSVLPPTALRDAFDDMDQEEPQKQEEAEGIPGDPIHPMHRPEAFALLLTREYAVLEYAAVDAGVLIVAGVLGVMSGIATDAFTCRAIAGSIVVLYALQCVLCIVLRAMNTLLGQVHSVASLVFATASMAFQTAYVVRSNGSTALETLEALEWMMVASAVSDLIVMGMGVVRMGFDAVELVGAAHRMVHEGREMVAERRRGHHGGAALQLTMVESHDGDDASLLDGSATADNINNINDGGSASSDAELDALFWDADGCAVADAANASADDTRRAPGSTGNEHDVFMAYMSSDGVDNPLGSNHSLIVSATLRSNLRAGVPPPLSREHQSDDYAEQSSDAEGIEPVGWYRTGDPSALIS